MGDPLAAAPSAIPTRQRQSMSTTSTADASLSLKWASFFRGTTSSSSEVLRTRGIDGKIAQDGNASLRWLQWKHFLTDHLSTIPSSWQAVSNRDREAYNELRCRLLRAPDGNYPPEVGFDGTHTTISSSAASSSSFGRTVVHDLSVNNPLSLDDSNPWKTYYSTLETRRIILQDVERTFPDLELFRQTRVQQSLTNILFLWSLQNEEVGYRQGMHELAAVLWKVRTDGALRVLSRSPTGASTALSQAAADAPFEHALADVFVEHDVYALFCVLMQSAKSWYAWRDVPADTASSTSPLTSPSRAVRPSRTSRDADRSPRNPLPIVAKCEYILELLRHIDPALAQHLESLGIEPQIFCLRWIRMIFTREFALDDAIAIWDGLFASAGSLDLIDYVCIAMLLRVRNQLLAGDHSSALQSLLRYPAEAQVQPSLLVKQAIMMRDRGHNPSTGVAVVMQNRDLLGIQVHAIDDLGHAASPLQPANHSPTHRISSQKYATVGRTVSGAPNRASPWTRLAQEPLARNPDAKRWQTPTSGDDPLGISRAPAQNADTGAARAFGINPSSYLPEVIGDLAKGWYERAEIPQSLNSALANVSRTVAAAAAAGVAGAYGSNKAETSGFPSGFDQAFTEQASARAGGSPATVGHAAMGKSRSRPSIVEPAQSISEPVQNSSADLAGQLSKLVTANKAIGSALSACIEVLEQSWLDRSASADEKRSDELEQSDLNTLMSFTALKHIRDVLDGTATEFDPATLPASVPKRVDSGSHMVKDGVKQQNAKPVEATPAPVKSQAAVVPPASNGVAPALTASLPMSLPEYARYGRQMILPDFGLPAQLRLRKAKVLVVGAGGLGCPSIQYLAAAGVGQISILDHDVVEPSNLARQILHSDASVGMSKAVSAAQAAKRINPYITATPLQEAISAANARALMRGHDLVLDCTDNPLTRYLISDAAVLEGVQVVSGAAQGYDGQLVVLHKRIRGEFAPPKVAKGGEARGPCYRCLFPKAPRPDEVTNCEDGGVLGGVTGLVGTMQALEAVKILAGIGEETPPSLTLVSPLTATPFRCVRIRPRRVATCRSCGDPAQVAEPMITDLEREDYVSFCGLNAPLAPSRVPRTAVAAMQPNTLVVDVRPAVEYGIAKLDGSLHVPLHTLLKDPAAAWDRIRDAQRSTPAPVLVVCKRGNDSQLAVSALLEHQKLLRDSVAQRAEASHPLQMADAEGGAKDKERAKAISAVQVSDLIGGLRAFSRDKDPSFPVY
ncbi:related to molybdenum cofactor biosynthetic protein [Sporisorium reilianum f. sp. reilianum]|uniref:Related to molybdenum cofactor biosynthetic protein n=1 Tax=Sporisorium reilianum f. sp. reilianum TaxID=72559 RepID=A0A2N8UD78_9BASI|nr:related to molybdenum cofactor biosynthetic protein [Sporisorium reilianum f. sp. reilianum]